MERKRIDVKKSRTPSGAAVQRPELTQALYRALFEVWAEKGYPAISLEQVATRARAGKAAIYRRWPSKLAFAREAIEEIGFPLVDTPDKGCLEDDLQAYLLGLRRVLRHPIVRRILPDLHAERSRSQEIADLLDAVAARRRTRGLELIERAVARGELAPTVDREMAMDLLPAPLYWRMIVRGRSVTRSELTGHARVLKAALQAA
ncbi:TetR/AcrR family transcriptional regulator [Labrenzia sp. OB1]|uniref:TetR/AcrR family transcriptional regulator n=1 Tax=Labrenzia sp. OB1 TaxID=1561204 RepID=UPI0007B1FD40|nr:TetR/AcrR family transcriptional regulator [Labrenzia sp. OB1]KZM51549.1 TetR family transcriptional regulator [Labrenzia sp. OB1]